MVARSVDELRIKTELHDRLFQIGAAVWELDQDTGLITFTSQRKDTHCNGNAPSKPVWERRSGFVRLRMDGGLILPVAGSLRGYRWETIDSWSIRRGGLAGPQSRRPHSRTRIAGLLVEYSGWQFRADKR